MIDKLLEDYKKITEEIILKLQSSVEIQEMMNERERIIKELFNKNDIENKKIKKIYIDKGLLELDKKLKISIKDQQLKIKEEIKKIHDIKNANNAYGRNQKINNFFSIKI